MVSKRYNFLKVLFVQTTQLDYIYIKGKHNKVEFRKYTKIS